MPELTRTQTVSRSAFLELQDERRLVNDGYEFLDEKRILLAAELLRQREAWRAARAAFMERWDKAAKLLPAAAADQGLEGLQVHPRFSLNENGLEISGRPYVGQVMLEATFDIGATSLSREPVRPSGEVRRLAAAFRDVLEAAAPLAAITANLRRLIREYRRTERRVRALENVVLPEIHQDLAVMEEHLDLGDQEEVIRVRSIRSA
ncbi:MAG: ATPase [Gammaproteobacteria bacterium]|jgi:V/A-type H+-transporting ATPase subunit D|nr:ATPase [Gammaproteobacteria bacterium]MDH3846954.1 ATPase [Gammaproteobacteria bacterium]MDH3904935.1 ATPase [Gammaproteobacteria bacterium]MDH3909443.1 ATPase [Gammaproteobacteria bacterium]MDH4005646.1 ATPase [Gammaproteobacteria bacterium]